MVVIHESKQQVKGRSGGWGVQEIEVRASHEEFREEGKSECVLAAGGLGAYISGTARVHRERGGRGGAGVRVGMQHSD
jgi:hypothetical protein